MDASELALGGREGDAAMHAGDREGEGCVAQYLGGFGKSVSYGLNNLHAALTHVFTPFKKLDRSHPRKLQPCRLCRASRR